MEPLALTIFWIIGILWAVYYWYWNTSTKRTNDNSTPKIVFDFNSNRKHSTSSIESLDYSDNEGTGRKHTKKLKYEIKTRWPSRTFMKAKDRSKSL